MAVRHNFEPDQDYKSPKDIIIQSEINEYERKNPDYEFHKLELVASEMHGCFYEIKIVFKHKEINVETVNG